MVNMTAQIQVVIIKSDLKTLNRETLKHRHFLEMLLSHRPGSIFKFVRASFVEHKDVTLERCLQLKNA